MLTIPFKMGLIRGSPSDNVFHCPMGLRQEAVNSRARFAAGRAIYRPCGPLWVKSGSTAA